MIEGSNVPSKYIRAVRAEVFRNQLSLGGELNDLRLTYVQLMDNLETEIRQFSGNPRQLIVRLDAITGNLGTAIGTSFTRRLTAATFSSNRILNMFRDQHLALGDHVPAFVLSPEMRAAMLANVTDSANFLGSVIRRSTRQTLFQGALALGDRRELASDLSVTLRRQVGAAIARLQATLRTESLRAASIGMQQSMDELSRTRRIRKQWIWSTIERKEHDAIDGQTRAVNEPFDVPIREGGLIQMMYPRDPAAFAYPSAVINCGCFHIPVPA